jgi:hypothetical protein
MDVRRGVEKLDSRVERLDTEMRLVRGATDEIRELVPDLNRGPHAKAKDALTSSWSEGRAAGEVTGRL